MRNPPDKSPNSPTSIHAIRLSLGLIYFHFGFLKLYPDLSPAEMIASYTAQRMSWHWLDTSEALRWVAVIECAVGFCFLFNVLLRWMAPVFFFHMAATFAPLFVLPEFAFKFAPLAPTIEGQYILKNFVLVAAGWVVLEPHLRTFLVFRRTRSPRQTTLPDSESHLTD